MKRKTWKMLLVFLTASVYLLLPCCDMGVDSPYLKVIQEQVQEDTELADTLDPTAGTAITLGTVTQTTVALFWGAASDNITAATDIEYRLVIASESSDIGSIELALAADEMMGWTAGTSGYTVAALTPDTDFWFAVLARDKGGNYALYAPVKAHTLNPNIPSPGTGPFFSDITQTYLSVSWTAGTDDVTPPADLEYKLVMSDSAEAIDTAAEANGDGPVIQLEWTAATLSKTVTGLAAYTDYYFAVLVRDSSGNVSLYAPQTVKTLGYSLTYYAGGAAGTVPEEIFQTLKTGSEIEVASSDTISMTGYTFLMWNTQQNGLGDSWSPGATLTIGSSSVELYAVWTANTYTVSFDAQNGSTPNPASKEGTYDAAYGTLAFTAYTDHTFSGWYTEPDGLGIQVTEDTIVKTATDHTLYAFWDYNGWTDLSGVSGEFTRAYDIALDQSDNIYITGYTGGGLDGETIVGYNTPFIMKYESSGVWKWTKLLTLASGGNEAKAYGIGLDSSANVYVTGYTAGSLNGVGCTGAKDSFLSRYDANGNHQWTRLTGVTNEQVAGCALVLDSSGNIYITGWTDTALDGQTLTGTADVFIMKYDSSGTRLWTRLFGAASTFGEPTDIALDPSGNIYITGRTKGDLNGEPSPGGTDDNIAFIMKCNSTGAEQWTVLEGGTNSDTYAKGLDLDSSGNLYISGYSNFDLNGKTHTGIWDTFVIKYNSSGTEQWTSLIGISSSSVYGYGITLDSDDNIYITGGVYGTLNGQIPAGSSDAFVMKYSSSMEHRWTRLLGGSGAGATGYSIALASSGINHTAGYVSDAGIDGIALTGSTDALVTSQLNY